MADSTQGKLLVLGLWSQPELGSFELSARTSLVLATHGAAVAADGVEMEGLGKGTHRGSITARGT